MVRLDAVISLSKKAANDNEASAVRDVGALFSQASFCRFGGLWGRKHL
jgi:hypothetical protein